MPVENASSGYRPVPQSGQPTKRPNSVSINLGASPNLKELLGAFAQANGDADAPLRAEQHEGRVSIVVPASPESVPSMWTRFKAALSNLPLLNRVDALRTARQEVSDVPLDQHQFAGAVLRNGILSAIRKDFGDGAADLAEKQMNEKPLTKRTVEQILKHAVDEGYVHRYRLPRTQVQLNSHDDGTEQRAAAQSSQPEKPVTAEELALRTFSPGRDGKLLKYCLDVVQPRLVRSNANAVAEAARDLHDRVQDFLSTRDRWPIPDAEEFQGEVMPLVAVMAEQVNPHGLA